MNLYYVTYSTSLGTVAKNYVVASSNDNAWVAVQANDPTAQQLESIDESYGSVIIGS